MVSEFGIDTCAQQMPIGLRYLSWLSLLPRRLNPIVTGLPSSSD